jgi:deoxyribose-phosphate aldolase
MIDSPDDVARLLDHAILQPFYTDDEMRREIDGLTPYSLASVCIKPSAVSLAVKALDGSRIGVGTVIGFPHGANRPPVKALEAKIAFDDGATEVDMVVNVGKALGADWNYVHDDISAVAEVARASGGLIKVIFETGLITDDGVKIKLCEICSAIGVDFVKTSTGFGFVKDGSNWTSTGAVDHDLILMRKHCAATVGVKASGGMRTLNDVLRVTELGVTRICTTSTRAIMQAAHDLFVGGKVQVEVSAGTGY